MKKKSPTGLSETWDGELLCVTIAIPSNRIGAGVPAKFILFEVRRKIKNLPRTHPVLVVLDYNISMEALTDDSGFEASQVVEKGVSVGERVAVDLTFDEGVVSARNPRRSLFNFLRSSIGHLRNKLTKLVILNDRLWGNPCVEQMLKTLLCPSQLHLINRSYPLISRRSSLTMIKVVNVPLRNRDGVEVGKGFLGDLEYGVVFLLVLGSIQATLGLGGVDAVIPIFLFLVPVYWILLVLRRVGLVLGRVGYPRTGLDLATLVMTAVLVATSHSTFAPRASATKRSGTIVEPLTIMASAVRATF